MLLRIFVGLVYLYAGLQKWADMDAFAETIMAYEIISIPWIVAGIAVCLPVLEAVLGAFIVIGVNIKENVQVVLIMSIGFVGALTSLIVRGIDIDCGCFSAAANSMLEGPWFAIEKNIVIAIACILILNLQKSSSIESPRSASFEVKNHI